jgi:hypothetical protein
MQKMCIFLDPIIGTFRQPFVLARGVFGYIHILHMDFNL